MISHLPRAKRLLSTSEIIAESRRAMTNLAWNHPFFALMGRRIFFRADVTGRTASIDAEGICYINPLFMSQVFACAPQLWEFVVAHELLHLVLAHFGRRRGRTVRRWNRAADRWINQLLTQAGIGGLCAVSRLDGLMPLGAIDAQRSSVEELFDIEPRQTDDSDSVDDDANGVGPGQGCGIRATGLLRGEGETPLPEATLPSSVEWHELIHIGLRAIAHRPGDPFRAIEHLLAPRITWRGLLASACASASASVAPEPSRRRRNRSVPADVFLPVAVPTTVRARLAILVDTSGSVSDEELHLVLAEIVALVRVGAEVLLITHDDRVRSEELLTPHSVTRNAAAQLALGRTGTRYAPAYSAVAARSESFHALIHFTDGEPSDPWPLRPINVGEVLVALVRPANVSAVPSDHRVVHLAREAQS